MEKKQRLDLYTGMLELYIQGSKGEINHTENHINNGFCWYLYKTLEFTDYTGFKEEFPELWKQKPPNRITFWWYVSGPIPERIEALKEAIKLCQL